MRLATLLAVAAVLAPSARAQAVPDTTAPQRYFPLEVGNRWEYLYLYAPGAPWPQPSPPPEPVAYWRWTVVDETVVGGEPAFTVRRETYSLTGAPGAVTTMTVRYDEAQARIVASESSILDYLWCRMDEPFHGGSCTSGVGYGEPVLGTTTAVKENYGAVTGMRYRFAADVGLLRYYMLYQKGNAQEDVQLQFAHVGGRSYGTPVPVLPVVVASEPEHEAPAFSLSAMPNPTTGPLALSLTVPAAGPVAVEAFDALGRRVYHAEEELTAGEHTLVLDASAWVSGPYVVRAGSGGGTASVRIVRR